LRFDTEKVNNLIPAIFIHRQPHGLFALDPLSVSKPLFYNYPNLIMTSKLIPADPSKVCVIRKVTPNITTCSAPFSRFGYVKVGGRGTIGKPAWFSAGDAHA
jgi:hypothetical protein